jgi:acyl-CoA synthetase (AMP-forming)/AMP-acid ligase II
MRETLQAEFYERLERAPDGRAITFYGADGDFEWATFEQVYRRAVGAAVRLQELGFERGDVCVIVLPSGAPTAQMVLGTYLLGGRPLLVAPPSLQRFNSSLPEIVRTTVARTQARVVVHDGSLPATGDDGRTRFLELTDELPPQPTGAIPRIDFDPTEPVGLQLTSGTTGRPRICTWSQSGVLAALEGMVQAMKLDKSDVCFNWTPLYHDMGLVNNFLLCLTTGVPLVMQSPIDFVQKPARWLRGLHDTGATVTWSPNFGYAMAAERVKDEELEGIRLDGMHSFWNAAERIHLESIEAFHHRFGAWGVTLEALKTNFGCAENVGGATFSDREGLFRVEHVDRDLLQDEWIAKPIEGAGVNGNALPIVSAGRPNPGMTIHILSGSGDPLPEGQVGEVALDTPSRMLGYLDDSEATASALDGDLLRTGDLGYLRDGELFWVGRVRERIVVRGKKLDPSDFEGVLLGIEGLRKGCFAAFGVDDPEIGTQKLIVVAEVREPLPRTSREIENEIRQRVYEQLNVTLNEVVLVRSGTLAKTSSGKRRHNHFAKVYREGGLEPFVVDGNEAVLAAREAGATEAKESSPSED